MADIKLKKFVTNLSDASASAPIGLGSSSPQPMTTGWPVGDTLMRTLVLRISGIATFTKSSTDTFTATVMGAPKFIQNLIFGTNLHQNLIENGMDGLTLFRMLSIAAKRDLYHLDLGAMTATGTKPFEVVYRIPLGDENAARYWDTVVDILTAQPYLRRVYNPASVDATNGALGVVSSTASTLQVTSLNVDATVECSTGPFTDSQGKPNFLTVAPHYQPYWDVFPVAITATRAQLPIYLPYGDRNIKRIFIFQRDLTTYGELANTICGVNDQDRFSLKLNGLPIVDNMSFLAQQNENSQEYAPATMGAGTIVIDFHDKLTDNKVRGARLSNDLNVITPGQQKFELDIDVTKPSGNPFLLIGMESVRALNNIAKRPEQTAPAVRSAQAGSAAGK